MTAYVNDEQKKEGAYGKAVKATLAATLAAGMVPAAAAFADEPAEAAAEGNDIETLSVSPENAFKAGKVTAAEDNEGNAIADLGEVSFVADGEDHFVVPTEFTPEQGKAIDVTDAKKYTFAYVTVDKDGKEVAPVTGNPKLPGAYGVKVTEVATGYVSDVAATFTIGSASLKDATLFEGTDVEDTEFVYTGTAIDLGLALNGEELVENDDYTVKYHAKGSSAVIAPDDLKNAGEYVAVVKGADDSIYEGQEVKIAFTIAKLDLSKADIKLDPAFKGGNLDAKVTIESIDNIKDNPGTADVNELDAIASAKVVSVPETIYGKGQGVYKVEVAAVADNANVTGKQTVEVVKTLNDDAQVLYDGKALKNIDTDYSKEDTEVFDATKLAAYDKNSKLIKDAKVNMVVREGDADGAVVENADLTKPGKWYVEVSVDAASTGYEYSSPVANFTVTVKDGDIAGDSDVFVKFDDAVVDGMTGKDALTYTGEDFFKKVSVVVKSGDKVLTEGKDYEVELQVKDDKNAYVSADAMIDQGDYQVVVTSDSYAIDKAQVVAFEVNPVDAVSLRIDPTTILSKDTNGVKYSFTGEAIVPVFEYAIDTTVAEADREFATLPVDSYEMTITKGGVAVDEMKELGDYVVSIADADAKDNYDVKKSDFAVKVTNEKVFSDVPNTEWYYKYVTDANNAGYMFGIADSDVFAPNQSTSRAMAAQVLARMAGATAGGDFVAPGFSDVANDAWYYEAVAWAAATDVVNGFPGTDEFRPEDNVTRAQFCIMMKNYADLTEQGKALAAGEADEILAKYEDGAAVPAWCKEEVAWAVKNEIFGGYSVLNVDNDITRAEMAKMTVAFQPAKLK